MRKIVVLSMISLDGVMQGPGGPKEDPSGGFKYGGWVEPYFEEVGMEALKKQLGPADYLLGRKTYDIWVDYWPKHGDFWPAINEGTKYVVSRKLKQTNPKVVGWEKSVVLKSVAEIKKVKNSDGPDLQVHGSANLIQTLLKNDLVDELWLKIYPITLGKGKKTFDKGAIPAAFELTATTVTPTGVIMANYRRAGKVKTGNVSV